MPESSLSCQYVEGVANMLSNYKKSSLREVLQMMLWHIAFNAIQAARSALCSSSMLMKLATICGSN
jgi:hypothetical protein